MKRTNKQKGYVLLAMLLVFFVSGSSLMINALNNRQSTAVREQLELQVQMAAAKEALLAYASNTSTLYADLIGPGYFPCPDMDNDGLPDLASLSDPHSLCASSTTVGRLPKYVPLPSNNKFDLSSAFANLDKQFWYAVSPLHLRTTYNTSASNKTNASLSRLTLDGTSNIVALIIAPGDALDTQNRASNRTLPSNYLDGTNGSSATNFISQYTANPEQFNDQVLAITHDELMQALGRNVAARIRFELETDFTVNDNNYPSCFQYSGNSYCPWIHQSFKNSVNGGWLNAEGWNAHSSTFTYSGSTYYFLTQSVYTRISAAADPTIYFFGCAQMVFTLNHVNINGVTRAGDTCQ